MQRAKGNRVLILKVLKNTFEQQTKLMFDFLNFLYMFSLLRSIFLWLVISSNKVSQ